MTIVYDDGMELAKDLPGRGGGEKRPHSWIAESLLLLGVLIVAGLLMPYARKHYFAESLKVKGAQVEYMLLEHAWYQELTGMEPPTLFRTVVALDLTRTQGLSDEEVRATRMFKQLNGLYLMNADVKANTILDLAKRKPLIQLLVRNCPEVDLKTIRELQSLRPDMTIHYRSTAFLGVYGASVKTQECRILQVEPDSAADQAGITRGDVIVSFNGTPVDDFDHLVALLGVNAAGDLVELEVDRDGETFLKEVTLGGWIEQ